MTRDEQPTQRHTLAPASRGEAIRVGALLRKETIGGLLLVSAATVAIVWANSPWAESYFALRDFEIGYEPWHLRLTLGAWAADGLLAVFFFLVGLELKREFVTGDLRQWDRALVPVAAAFGGVLVPALIYVGINWGSAETLRGWAIPTATDIAFAVAVLAIIGSHLPASLRLFLLTLAVVDDLIAIVIIAVIYSGEVQATMLAWSLIPLVAYAVLARRFRLLFRYWQRYAWLVLLPIAAVFWALIHASGIHATIAGVVLGFTVPVRIDRSRGDRPGHPGLAGVFEHRFRPLSAGVAVPVFAFFSAGVATGGWAGLTDSLGTTVTLGIILGLVLGKPIGIVVTTWALTRFTRSSLDASLRWIDVFGVALLAGIGFTVSLLVAELSFGVGPPHGDHAKVGIFLASLAAALLGAAVLAPRNRHHRAAAAESRSG